MNVKSENIRCSKLKTGNVKVTAAVIMGDKNIPFELQVNPKIADDEGREFLIDDFENKLLTEINNLYMSCS